MTISAVYAGEVVHRRVRPRAHRLRYRIFMMLIDIDELPDLSRRLRWFSHDRFNLVSFRERDHGDGGASLRAWVDRQLADAGIDATGGAIQVLCMPRLLGHAFNPLSVFFCHRQDGTLAALLYEVNNTFGQRHTYLLPVLQADRPVRQECRKLFHVSPFLPMELRYRFHVAPPAEQVGIAVQALDETGPLILTRFVGRRRELSDATLLRAFLGAPLLGLKTLGAIHWEALKLWRKGLRFHPLPPPPAAAVTLHRQT